MQRKYGFWTTLVGLLLVTAVSVYAQANAVCPTLVQESYTATEFLCEAVPDGQACIGNGVVNATPIDGATVQFANPGELATLAQLQRLQVQTLNTDTQAWTSVTAKLDASTRQGEPAIVDMLVFGDAVVSNALATDETAASADVLPATIEAAGGIIVRQDARIDSNNIWQLRNAEAVQAIGRSADNQWVRILIPSPNGGAGWVFGQFIAVDGGQELLPFQTNASPIPETAATSSGELTLKPMQAFRLESLLTDPSCADSHDSGVMLQSPNLDTRVVVEVNGVELRMRGTVFITAQIGDKMTIYNLEGETAVIIGDDRVDMTLATKTEIPMDASLAPTQSVLAVVPYSQDTADVLILLPIRLMSRIFEITTVEAGQTGDTVVAEEPTNQTAPPPPAATEAPIVEDVQQPDNCPTFIQESYTATEFLCEGLSPNSACIGNAGDGMVSAIAREGVENFAFAGPGEIVNITDIDLLQTRVFDDPNNTWASLSMTLDAKTTTGGIAQATIMLIGEVRIENEGDAPTTNAEETDTTTSDTNQTAPPPPATDTSATTDSTDGLAGTIQSPGGIIVRAQPRVDTETVGQLQDGDTVTALGRSVDQQWVQVQSATGVTGWVFLQFVAIDGGTDALPIIDPSVESSTNTAPPPPATNQTAPPPPAAGATSVGDGPEFTLMQAFEFFSTKVDELCADSTNSGLLIQSPDGMDGELRLQINGVIIELAGTTFLQAQENSNMNILGLEGETRVTVGDDSKIVAAGERTSVSMVDGLKPGNPANPISDYPFDVGSRLQFLPIRLLPRIFEPVVPPAPADEASVVENNTQDSSTDTTTQEGVVNIGGTIVDFDAACEMSAGDQVRNLRADAGPGFDVIGTLQPGQTIVAASQKRGSDQYYWYETARGWIRQDAGIPTADCANLPLFGVIYDTTGTAAGSTSGSTASVAPVAPPAPPQPTAVPPPPVASEGFGNVCENGGGSFSVELEQGGINYVEFGGLWTGQAGTSITFSADIPYYRAELGNVLTFVNEDGSQWLGSVDSTSFTVNFDSTRRFRVRVAALLGDFVTLRVNC